MPKAAKRAQSLVLAASHPYKAPQKDSEQVKPKGALQVEVASVNEMRHISAVNREKFGKSKKTLEQYRRYINRGREFLAVCVQQRREDCAAAKDDIDDELLLRAFDNPPNKHSAEALELFMVQKCLREDCGGSTSVSIHSAFAWHWDNMDGERYAGAYTYDGEQNEVRGCPAHAPFVKTLLKTIKAKGTADGGSRKHALPMTIEDMTHLVRWSERVCPPVPISGQGTTMEEQALTVTRHVFMRAFMTTAFTLWTRNFELCGLRAGHITGDFMQPPHNLPYLRVSIVNRKGWLRKVNNRSEDDGPLENRTYKIYKQKVHEIDMRYHMHTWRTLLERRLGRPLENEDYIFPYIAKNGIPHPDCTMSYQKMRELLNDFTEEAGLHSQYSTHCFRRGGAQYRFMYAPIGQRWTLNAIRWWGGWADGEKVDTLMHYLINSLQADENDYSDQLNPMQLNTDAPGKSLMGEHLELQPATLQDVRILQEAIMNHLDRITVVPAPFNFPTHPPVTTVMIPSAAAVTERNNRHHAFTPHAAPAAASTESDTEEVPAVIPGIRIPDLKAGEWKKALDQWYRGDPTARLRPLKDWEPREYQGRMRKVVASKRRTRELIAMAYERCGSDNTAFIQAYPQATRAISQLADAIRQGYGLCRTSKNGTAAERQGLQTPASASA
ncbi:hypothetical protein AX14_003512 [Amanita brunnescens Koide BX004]|nr:hypothetical protein AX14_003512 [Amanita brunnescens Koide BX004]